MGDPSEPNHFVYIFKLLSIYDQYLLYLFRITVCIGAKCFVARRE